MGRLIIPSQLKLWLSPVTTWSDRRLHYIRLEIPSNIRHNCIMESVNFFFFTPTTQNVVKPTKPIPILKMSNIYHVIVTCLCAQSQSLPEPPTEVGNYEVWAHGFLQLLVSHFWIVLCCLLQFTHHFLGTSAPSHPFLKMTSSWHLWRFSIVLAIIWFFQK